MWLKYREERFAFEIRSPMVSDGQINHDFCMLEMKNKKADYLKAVGLTAAVASALAKEGISANVIAAYHHDHVFVPVDKANQAIQILTRLSGF